MAAREKFSSALHELIERWVRANNSTYEKLLRQAGVAVSVGTDIRRGSSPRAETLRKLAEVMGVSPKRLFEATGYMEKEDAGDKVDITDPELRLFFRGEWDELTETEREFIRGAIRTARELRRKRGRG